jgi:hypothetical protein
LRSGGDRAGAGQSPERYAPEQQREERAAEAASSREDKTTSASPWGEALAARLRVTMPLFML